MAPSLTPEMGPGGSNSSQPEQQVSVPAGTRPRWHAAAGPIASGCIHRECNKSGSPSGPGSAGPGRARPGSPEAVSSELIYGAPVKGPTERQS